MDAGRSVLALSSQGSFHLCDCWFFVSWHNDYETLSERLEKVEGVQIAIPLVEGQALVSGVIDNGTGALVRGLREKDIKRVTTIADGVANPKGTGQGRGTLV